MEPHPQADAWGVLPSIAGPVAGSSVCAGGEGGGAPWAPPVGGWRSGVTLPAEAADHPSAERERPPERDTSLAHNRDKSGSATGCPDPRRDRVFEVVDSLTGEITRVPIPCGRNDCGYCRPRNVQVTAAMMGLNATMQANPPTQAVLTTTRDWVDEVTLREGWAQMARRVRREIHPETGYAWFREWTRGLSDGIRRTHYHSIWTHVDGEQGAAIADVSREVWGRLAGAYSERAHGAQAIWDAGGLARYVAGLAGHHGRTGKGQDAPPGWTGRRVGTSRGFYAMPADELRRQARDAVRDERLRHRLEVAVTEGSADRLPEWIVDEAVTARLQALKQNPPPAPRVVRVRPW